MIDKADVKDLWVRQCTNLKRETQKYERAFPSQNPAVCCPSTIVPGDVTRVQSNVAIISCRPTLLCRMLEYAQNKSPTLTPFGEVVGSMRSPVELTTELSQLVSRDNLCPIRAVPIDIIGRSLGNCTIGSFLLDIRLWEGCLRHEICAERLSDYRPEIAVKICISVEITAFARPWRRKMLPY